MPGILVCWYSKDDIVLSFSSLNFELIFQLLQLDGWNILISRLRVANRMQSAALKSLEPFRLLHFITKSPTSCFLLKSQIPMVKGPNQFLKAKFLENSKLIAKNNSRSPHSTKIRTQAAGNCKTFSLTKLSN